MILVPAFTRAPGLGRGRAGEVQGNLGREARGEGRGEGGSEGCQGRGAGALAPARDACGIFRSRSRLLEYI